MGLRSLGNNYQANLGQKKVCSTCVNDPILEKEISQSGTISSCSYCDVHSATWSLKILVNRIEDVYTTLVRPGNYELDGLQSQAMIGYGMNKKENLLPKFSKKCFPVILRSREIFCL